jgi:hypothetical protein
MTTSTQNLTAQAHTFYTGSGTDYSTANADVKTGLLFSGDYSTALRFALPDLSGQTLTSVELNLRDARVEGSSSGVNAIAIIKARSGTDQTLPADVTAMLSGATLGSEAVSIGGSSASADLTLTTSSTDYSIDITDIVAQALAAGDLSSGYICIVLRRGSSDDAQFVVADGLGATGGDEPTLYLVYESSSTTAIVDQSFDPMTVSAAGESSISGVVSVSFDSMTIVAEGFQPVQAGSVEATFDPMTVVAEGSPVSTGVVNATFDAMTASAFGSSSIDANTSVSFNAMTVAASGFAGAAGVTAELDQSFDAMTVSASGVLAFAGEVNASFDAMTAAAVGSNAVIGSVTVTFAPMTAGAASIISPARSRRGLFPVGLFPQDSLFVS